MFSGPDDGRGLAVTGYVDNCVFSGNSGMPVFDDDRTNGPIDDIQYNSNRFYSTTFGAIVYRNVIPGIGDKNVNDLNSLVVTRANGTSTDKSLTSNISLGSEPIVGTILVVPHILSPNDINQDGYIGVAWSGGSATLDGIPIFGNTYVTTFHGPGEHTLSVGGVSFTAEVTELVPAIYLPLTIKSH
jgi:hypothetical protein